MKPSVPIGRYHLLDRMGAGGMAEVYRARYLDDEGLERLVALKRVLSMYADDPSFVQMLVAEYRLSTLLVHPNIAQIYELLRTDDGYFIVMELVDGKDLRTVLQRALKNGRHFDIADAVYVMARAVDGLHHAHVATLPDGTPLDLVHRDFSPSNILIGYDGSVKIIDFGIAKANIQRDRTAVGVIKGKVRYMSPEQANGDAVLTGQSDVFSAGSVLYELLTGEPAFMAATEIELIYTVRRAQPVPLRTHAPHVPEALEAIVRRAMSLDLKERYPNAAAFRDALVGFLRAYLPGYRRTRLSNHMKTAFGAEIDEEIRTLLEYAMSDTPGGTAENLFEHTTLEESLRDVRSVSTPALLAVQPDDLFAQHFYALFDPLPEHTPTVDERGETGVPLAPDTDEPTERRPPLSPDPTGDATVPRFPKRRVIRS